MRIQWYAFFAAMPCKPSLARLTIDVLLYINYEDTLCWQCGALLIDRYGFHVRANRIRKDCCPDRGCVIDSVGMSTDEAI